jgi:hypothetical protein
LPRHDVDNPNLAGLPNDARGRVAEEETGEGSGREGQEMLGLVEAQHDFETPWDPYDVALNLNAPSGEDLMSFFNLV